MSQSPPASAKAAAQALASALGGQPSVQRFYADNRAVTVDVAEKDSCPEPGLQVASTLTLHQTPNATPSGDIRVELMMVVAQPNGRVAAHAVSSAAFFVMRNGWQAKPGSVFMDLMRENDRDAAIPHVLWTTPFPWPSLNRVKVADHVDAHWLLGVPLFETERLRLLDVGLDQFEQEMAEADLAYYDLTRRSFA